MSTLEFPQFSASALAVLDQQPYDPNARGKYEWLSGALVWSDELPGLSSSERAIDSLHRVFRFLIAYRGSITVGEEQAAFRPIWEQVVQHAPNWPGLREERRGDQARRRLLAAKRQESRCLEELEQRFEHGDAE